MNHSSNLSYLLVIVLLSTNQFVLSTARLYSTKENDPRRLQNLLPIEFPYAAESKCFNESSDCKVRVAVQCTYKDEDGVTRSCIDIMEESQRPFTYLTKDTCKAMGKLQVSLSYRMCNDNDRDFIPNSITSYASFRQKEYFKSWLGRIPANDCISFTVMRKINPCKEKRALEVAMDGILAKRSPNYCRCYLYKESNIAIVEVAPSSNPSLNPIAEQSLEPSISLSPSAAPSDEPSDAPSLYPTITPAPSANPSSTRCEISNVIITELAAPFNEQWGSYIELYFGRECGGNIIRRNIRILRWLDGNEDLSTSQYRLNGKRIPDDGFMVICGARYGGHLYGENGCDYIGGVASPANVKGTETVAIVEKNGMNVYKRIDIYGMLDRGTTSKETNQDFTGGRAVRKHISPSPEAIWNPDNWIVIRGNGVQSVKAADLDPGSWGIVHGPPKIQMLMTEIFYPAGIYTPRFIELFVPRYKDRGKILSDDLKLVVFKGNETEPDWDTAINLQYVKANGFIVVCNIISHHAINRFCDITVKGFSGGALDSDGHDQLAIVNGDEKSFYVVDLFGVIGEPGFGTIHDFDGLRIVRKRSIINPESVWLQSDWIMQDIIDNDPNVQGDPGKWEG